MTDAIELPASPRRGWADKRDAMLSAALRVFGRDGYSRASIDVIAAEAEVSSRTIYNHFGGKAELFRAVIEQSASRVADMQIALINRTLGSVVDIESDLIAFGTIWAAPNPQFDDHFALVRQIAADSAHIALETLQAWQQTGPLRVRDELATRLRNLADRGLLAIDDPQLAASHLILLTATEVANRSAYRATALTVEELNWIVNVGIRTFLHGYGRRAGVTN